MSARRTLVRWHLAVAAAALGLYVAWPGGPAGTGPRDESPARRVLGPLAGFAADVQWVRFDLALRRGRPELAYARAATALWLDRGATAGWSLLAYHQAFERGSREREADPTVRLAWIQAGLATARRGERAAREPGELALLAGLILLNVAELDPDVEWPGGRERLWLDAAEHLDRAREHGLAFAGDLADAARERHRATPRSE